MFDRPLGIKRNSVVLPAGYELTSCNIPSQVIEEPDGRIAISFMNPYPSEAPLVIKARPVRRASAGTPSTSSARTETTPAATTVRDTPMDRIRVSERAFQDREIVYFLKEPETHAFSLYHDYTESRDGVDKYLNVVRRGSTVSDPSAKILDTGETLKVETLKGGAITKAGIDIGEPVRPQSEVVVVRFPKLAAGETRRIRVSETYTDPARYRLDGEELVFDRSFGRPRNAVVLPAGWYLTACSIPAAVSETADGRIRLDFVNPRPDEIDVLLKARRRPAR